MNFEGHSYHLTFRSSVIKQYFLTILLLSSLILGQDRVLIEGKAEYNFSDNETLIEAKSLCYNMALRNAVESYQIFVSSMVDVRNMQVRNDIIQTLSTGYLEDLTVVDEKIDKVNNIIYYRLKAYIKPEPFKKALKQEVARKVNFARPAFIKETNSIRILQATKGGGYINIVYQAKRQLDTSVQLNITFYDSDGNPVGGDKRKFGYGLGKDEVRTESMFLNQGHHFELWFPEAEKKVVTYTKKAAWKNKINWRQLSKGMTKSQVRGLLGEPRRIESIDYFGEVWKYTDLDYSGTVKFHYKDQRLVEWSEPK